MHEPGAECAEAAISVIKRVEGALFSLSMLCSYKFLTAHEGVAPHMGADPDPQPATQLTLNSICDYPVG